MNNSMKMEFLSISENESFARSAVAAFVAQLNPTLDEIEDIKAAVSEAVTNAIVHGYKNEVGDIYITVTLEDNVVKIRIRDKGCGIENIKQAMEPLFTTGGEERAGLGFAVMESFMDSVRVRSKVGKGTTVTLAKRLSVRLKVV